MGSHAAIEDAQMRAMRFLSVGNAEAAQDTLLRALDKAPMESGLLQVLLRCQNALGDHDGAADTRARLMTLSLDPALLDLLVGLAVSDADFRQARSLIAQAETEIAMSPWAIARAKARVAQAMCDLQAAAAILVEALEANPNANALRPLLTEVLIAGGSAGHARDVLARLGLAPVTPSTADPAQGNASRDRA